MLFTTNGDLFTQLTQQYVSATAGGVLLQILLSGFGGVLVILGLFRHRIVRLFRRHRSEEKQGQPGRDA